MPVICVDSLDILELPFLRFDLYIINDNDNDKISKDPCQNKCQFESSREDLFYLMVLMDRKLQSLMM